MNSRGIAHVFILLVLLILISIVLFIAVVKNQKPDTSQLQFNSNMQNFEDYSKSKENKDTTSITEEDENKKQGDAELTDLDHYMIENNKVYLIQHDERILVEEADANTFQKVLLTDTNQLNRGYYKDKNYVYYAYDGYGDKKLENSDAQTFHLLNPYFAKDKNQAYYDGKTGGGIFLLILEDVDTNTFSAVTAQIAKDIHNVYFAKWDKLTVIEEADPHTIEEFETGSKYSYSLFTKDSKNVFFKYNKVEGVDVETFTLLHNDPARYGKDKNSVFYCGGYLDSSSCYVINGADVESFELIWQDKYPYAGGYIAKDKNTLYSRGEPIENSNPATFEMLDVGNSQEPNAKDKNQNYFMWCDIDGCRLEIESKSTRYLY